MRYPILVNIILVILFLCGPIVNQIHAQDDSPIQSRLKLDVIQGDNDNITLKALLRAKIEGRYTGLPGLEISFLSVLEDSLENEIGNSVTNGDGIAILEITKSKLLKDTADNFLLYAEFEGNKSYKKSDTDLEFIDAELKMIPKEEDSIRSVSILLQSKDVPVADEDVSLFVKGMFSSLLVGEETTDDEGQAEFEFPADLPGDVNGSLHFFTRLPDHDEFGTIESHTKQNWGIPTEQVKSKLPRALWSPYPPLWLLLTFLGILLFIWAHYFEVIYKLYKMKTEQEKSE